MQRKSKSVIILLSGGVDSTALVQYYLAKNYEVRGVYFVYGQATKDMEQLAVRKVSEYYQIETDIVDLGLSLKQKNGEFFGRNALFVVAASGILPEQSSNIAIGVHRGVPYYDCSEVFIADCQNLLDGYFTGTVLLDAPFLKFTKRQIYDYCIENKVPVELTYSCEKGNTQPCGTCSSCLDRRILDEFSCVSKKKSE